ncbi:hypothetical protein GQ53DRAFT_719006 [Thozetella sp. PMI_491]|nr:hypothetical protein GQ53DRAFT_719006 [Thozetella sp. PMI_491]
MASVSDGAASADQATPSRRRKVRRGTRSCWECRRRKIRCVFDEADPPGSACINCRRRATACIGQEFPDDSPASGPQVPHLGHHLVRVEALIQQLVNKVENTNRSAGLPGEGILSSGSPATTDRTSNEPRNLCSAWPSPEDVRIICRLGASYSLYLYQMMVTPHNRQEHETWQSLDIEKLASPPDPATHPTIIARSMFILAICLQSARSELRRHGNPLSTSPEVITAHLTEAAGGLVCNRDEFMETAEGLECVILQGLYQANSGSVRQAWRTFRRAIVIAQLMGMHRRRPDYAAHYIDPSSQADPNFMWFRIVQTERFLSLLLGLPQGSHDVSVSGEAAMGPDGQDLERLERLHCSIASRILDRNEHDSYSERITVTREIDMEVQKAAKAMPTRWWLMPNLAGITQDLVLFWTAWRIAGQMFHYYLLVQLHLPYLLRTADAHDHGYSRITCVTSSREVLTRFNALRGAGSLAGSWYATDFCALFASIVLLLAHIEGRSESGEQNFLAHQRVSDRALVEQAFESMSESSRESKDVLLVTGSDALQWLLEIEADAPGGFDFGEQSSSGQRDSEYMPRSQVLRLRLPGLGTLDITQDGRITRRPSGLAHPSLSTSVQASQSVEPRSSLSLLQQSLPSSSGPPTTQSTHFSSTISAHIDTPSLVTTADADDWTLHGVDVAFFDTLVRGAGSSKQASAVDDSLTSSP